jgi:hypothetical protein
VSSAAGEDATSAATAALICPSVFDELYAVLVLAAASLMIAAALAVATASVLLDE